MSILHVAVAAIVNADEEVLVALRPDHVHQGGLWEFPGGKLQDGEDIFHGLKRELNEELGIDVRAAHPLIQVRHDYEDRSVLLDVWCVEDYRGVPQGMEGQPIRWCKISELKPQTFPEANHAIIKALQLPDCYMISGEFRDIDDFQSRLNHALSRGIRLVQLRTKNIMQVDLYRQIAEQAYEACESSGARLLLNVSPENFSELPAHGLHLSSRALFSVDERPVGENSLLSVSCHNEKELQHARLIQADLVLLSPVRETRSHPGVAGIGWPAFRKMVEAMDCPVYALGGMTLADLEDAKNNGAQGIAAISEFWTHE